MARGRPVQFLAALCLLIFLVALHADARAVPDANRDCGPLQRHRYRCDPPLTRTVQADPEQLAPADTREASSGQGDELTHAPPASAHELKEDIAHVSSISGAAHDGVEAAATSIPISKDPECGPLEKDRYRCGNPPRIRVRDTAHLSSTSGAAHDGVEAAATSIPISKDPECGPLEKDRYRCGNPPRIRVRDTAHLSSTSGAAHDGVEAAATSIPISKDPECGPLEKNRYRCGNPPRIRVKDINALG